jgi:alkaline phosphatase D
MIAAAGMLPSVGAAPPREWRENPFSLGVASGSPMGDGFVIWTRLMGSEVDPMRSVEVQWEVFEEGHPDKPVAEGATLAPPELGHSVHVEVSGLKPNRWYGYVFKVGGMLSSKGRSRTLPTAEAPAKKLRLAYASCQRWEDGFYAAYRHMAAESLDLVVFVGDYIYEYKARQGETPRTHDLPEVHTLEDYRQRYALYKSDKDLQAMHALCPWLVTWDDHEVENNYAGLYSAKGTLDMAARRVSAYQAYYENMPLRASTMIEGLVGLQKHGALRIYGQVEYGPLATIFILDNRQYRDAPKAAGSAPEDSVQEESGPVLDRRTMLGKEQEKWLDQGLKTCAQKGTAWTIIAQQSGFTPRNYRHGRGRRFSPDCWDGYPGARERLIKSIVKNEPKNPILLGGDIHQNWVAQVYWESYDVSSRIIASEFCGTSISSRAGATQERARKIAEGNPHALLANAEKRGYGVVEITDKQATVQLRVLDNVALVNARISTLASFVVQSGDPKILKG